MVVEQGVMEATLSGQNDQTAPLSDCTHEALIPVKYSDADIHHRFGVQLLYQQDVLPFLEDELYGENWDASAVLQDIRLIAAIGKGQVDPVNYISGHFEYASFVPPPLRCSSRPAHTSCVLQCLRRRRRTT